MAASVVLSDLAYATPEGHRLFSGLGLTFGPARTGLVGRNGVGKTTPLRLISGELRPRAGRVAVSGRVAVRRLKPRRPAGRCSQAVRPVGPGVGRVTRRDPRARLTMPKKPSAGTPAKPRAGAAGPAPARANVTTTTHGQVLKQLESLGNEATRKQNARWAAGGIQPGATQFGVKHGDIRALAKRIGPDRALALSLWETRNVDAQLLAVLLVRPKDLSPRDVDRLVRSVTFGWVADWLISYVVKPHPDKEALRQAWMADGDRWAARAGWALTAERVAKDPAGLDLPALLGRIEAEMGGADPAAQWTMNAALAEIGIRFPELRGRAVAVGEKLGVYRDYPVSKGCTSPFAPVWIAAMAGRRG